MSKAIAVFHGAFGRATVYKLDRNLLTHAHREGHLIFYVDGTQALMKVGEAKRALTRQVGVAVSPWQAHSMTVQEGASGLVCLVLYIRPEWFESLSSSAMLQGMRFGRPFLELSPDACEMVQRLTTELLGQGRSDQLEQAIFDLAQTCFALSWQSLPSQAGRFAVSGPGRDARISQSLRLMSERLSLGDNIILDGIARDVGLSRPHFFKLFREHVGLTPNLYLNTLRMENSLFRLTRTDDQITSIGLDLGFSCQASFSRFFVSNVGIAPSHYRRVAFWLDAAQQTSAIR